MTVYFYYGEEDFNIDLEISEMKSKLNKDFISMSYHQYDNPDYQTLITVLRTPPMMFGRMLIVINSEGYFSGNKNWFTDEELKDIEDALTNCHESLDIVFSAKFPRGEGKKPDSRRKLFKILSKFNIKEFPLISIFKTSEISAWVNKRAMMKGISISNDGMECLIEQIGNDLRQYNIELDKLQLIAYPEKIVTKEMIEDVCISNQDLFNITNFLMKNEKDKAVLEFKKLTDKKHPLEILSAIQTMLRQWIIIKIKASSSPQEIMKLTGIRNEYRLTNLKRELKNINVANLVRLKENLFDIEYRLKIGSVNDIESEVECALIK